MTEPKPLDDEDLQELDDGEDIFVAEDVSDGDVDPRVRDSEEIDSDGDDTPSPPPSSGDEFDEEDPKLKATKKRLSSGKQSAFMTQMKALLEKKTKRPGAAGWPAKKRDAPASRLPANTPAKKRKTTGNGNKK